MFTCFPFLQDKKREREIKSDPVGSASLSHRPPRHSCPLEVSIETQTCSTVGAESVTEAREDPHIEYGGVRYKKKQADTERRGGI